MAQPPLLPKAETILTTDQQQSQNVPGVSVLGSNESLYLEEVDLVCEF
jgi:hypothetical protein